MWQGWGGDDFCQWAGQGQREGERRGEVQGLAGGKRRERESGGEVLLYSRSRARVSGRNEKLSVCELEFSWRTHRADTSRLRIAHERNLTPHRTLALPPRPFDVYRPCRAACPLFFYFLLFLYRPPALPKGVSHGWSPAGVKGAGAFFEGVSRGQHVSPWPRALDVSALASDSSA